MLIERELRQRIPNEEFDYQVLLDVLRHHARPRDKITKLIKKGVIVRVKKGLYIFASDYARSPYSPEVLANLIYGPSYISLDYALHYYGMIPEKVVTVTSVTSGKNRVFETPIGRFTYQAVPLAYYRVGIDIAEPSKNSSFMIATKEKALADKIYQGDSSTIRNIRDLESHLTEHLRIDQDSLSQLDHRLMAEIAGQSRSKKLSLLSEYIKSGQGPA